MAESEEDEEYVVNAGEMFQILREEVKGRVAIGGEVAADEDSGSEEDEEESLLAPAEELAKTQVNTKVYQHHATCTYLALANQKSSISLTPPIHHITRQTHSTAL